MNLIEMIVVNMDISEGMHEGAYFKVTNMSNKMGEECIRSNIERNT